MELFIAGGQSLQNLDGVLNRRLVDCHRLEAPLQGGVFFDGPAVLVERRGPDYLNFPPRQGGFEDVGGVHAAFRVPGSGQIVDLVDHEDDVPQPLDLVDQALHAALELSPELRPGHKRRQVQQMNLFFPQFERHVSRRDPLGQSLRDSGFAHAGFPDQAGIVFLAAVQNLYHPFNLFRPSDHRVQLSVPGPLRQGDAVIFQILALALFGVLALFFLGRGVVGVGGLPLSAAGKEAVQKGEGGGFSRRHVVFAVFLSGGQVFHILHAVHRL